MAGVKLTVAMSALALSGVLAVAAHADPLITDPTKAMPDRNQWGPADVHKTYEWDAAKSRWGIQLDVNTPGARSMNWKDVQAGAYFKLTPQLQVGGAVALGDPNIGPLPREAVPQPSAPHVRLETAFKF
jgi:hypothetical protein